MRLIVQGHSSNTHEIEAARTTMWNYSAITLYPLIVWYTVSFWVHVSISIKGFWVLVWTEGTEWKSRGLRTTIYKSFAVFKKLFHWHQFRLQRACLLRFNISPYTHTHIYSVCHILYYSVPPTYISKKKYLICSQLNLRHLIYLVVFFL